VLFRDLGETVRRQAAGEPDERGPQATMNERDLATDQLADEHVAAVGDVRGGAEDLLSFRVAPPASTDALAGHELGEVGHAAARGPEDDAFALDEGEGLSRVHHYSGTPVTTGPRQRRTAAWISGATSPSGAGGW